MHVHDLLQVACLFQTYIIAIGGYSFATLSVLRRSCQFYFIDAYTVAQVLNERQSLFSLASLAFNLPCYNHIPDYFIPHNVTKKLHLLYSQRLCSPLALATDSTLSADISADGEGFLNRTTFQQLPVVLASLLCSAWLAHR